MRTALVIGAGVAGPVAAMALQRAGIHAEVFEAHPTGADDVGAWLTLQANGIDAVRAVDAHRLVAALGYPTRTMRFVNGKGKVLGRMTNGPVLPDGTGSQMVPRSDLYVGLRDMAEFHHERNAIATLALTRPRIPWGVVDTDSFGHIRDFIEAPPSPWPKPFRR